jgi:hypothetical protein
MHPGMIDEGVAVSDEIAQADRATHLLRQIAIDRMTVRQDEERRARIIRCFPALVDHPMKRQIDAFLDGQKKVEARKILGFLIDLERLRGA